MGGVMAVVGLATFLAFLMTERAAHASRCAAAVGGVMILRHGHRPGALEHNLKSSDLELPLGQLVMGWPWYLRQGRC